MKKIILLILTFVVLNGLNLISFGTDNVIMPQTSEDVVEITTQTEEEPEKTEEKKTEKKEKNNENVKMNQASEEIINTMSKKEERIQLLTEKYNNKALGTVAYGLEVVRFYSTPIFFIFLTIGAFNFFIVGNKKLDKKEQGFGWMTACIIGWVVFQCIPLVFTLVTLGVTK